MDKFNSAFKLTIQVDPTRHTLHVDLDCDTPLPQILGVLTNVSQIYLSKWYSQMFKEGILQNPENIIKAGEEDLK